jgi:hypothetical protein
MTKVKTKVKHYCANKNCGKRIRGNIIMECKCGAKFCKSNHMTPYNEHSCSFDFIKDDKIKLKSQLTTAFTDNNTKLQRI